jgi:hypothetical protein
MHLQWLGDALDHWKGAMFEYLQNEGKLANFRVDPMATDDASWSLADLRLYARLLRVSDNRVIRHQMVLRASRAKYFLEIPDDGDLFLDPDVGIHVGEKPGKNPTHLMPDEIFQLMSKGGRILAVYQHKHQRLGMNITLDRMFDALRHNRGSFSCVSYLSGTVALMFLSRTSERTDDIASRFRDLLGGHANNRIRSDKFDG